MATKFAVPQIDVKAEATRALYAYAGVNDLAVEIVRGKVTEAGKKVGVVQDDVEDTVDDAKKSVRQIDLTPRALVGQATGLANTALEAVVKDLKSRREAVETKVSETVTEVKGYPAKAKSFVGDNVDSVTSTYDDLVKRGEGLVGRLRTQESTQDAVASAKTAVSKVKATRTQLTKAAEAKVAEVTEDVKDEVDKVTERVNGVVAPVVKKASGVLARPARKAAEVADEAAIEVEVEEAASAPATPIKKPAAKKAPAAKKSPASTKPAVAATPSAKLPGARTSSKSTAAKASAATNSAVPTPAEVAKPVDEVAVATPATPKKATATKSASKKADAAASSAQEAASAAGTAAEKSSKATVEGAAKIGD